MCVVWSRVLYLSRLFCQISSDFHRMRDCISSMARRRVHSRPAPVDCEPAACHTAVTPTSQATGVWRELITGSSKSRPSIPSQLILCRTPCRTIVTSWRYNHYSHPVTSSKAYNYASLKTACFDKKHEWKWHKIRHCVLNFETISSIIIRK